MFALLRKYSYYLTSLFELIFGFENPLLVVLIVFTKDTVIRSSLIGM